ncbi:VENN motif pre-toxin domain-containing protein [Neisseria yangbaofengii]|uniref:VENN motif pre-toxin domain-containing protein n=2 Tax=Neisseria yangbaofengii TaxID=2709396 RepID=UPI003BA25E56
MSAPTDSTLGIAAATASPAVSYQIGQYFKELAQQNSDGKLTAKQETAHILAHAVLGAATAAAGDNNALTGAISAGSAEAAAPLIGSYLYGEKDGSKLTTEQKETVTAITSLLGAATGATVGNSATNAAQGSLNADSAVENNSILSRTARTRLNPQSKVLYDRIIQKGNFHTVEDFNHAYAQCPNKACQNAVVQAFQKERERFFTYLADEIKDGKQRELLIKEFAPVMSGENSLLGGRFGQAAAINWSGYQDGFLARFPDAWIEKDKIAQKTASGMSLEQAERSAMKEMLIPQAISAALVGAVGSKINPAYKAAKQTDGSHAKPKEPSTVDGEMVFVPQKATGGGHRAETHSKNWQKADLNQVIKKFIGTNPKVYFTPKGKAIYEGKNGIQVIYDIEGRYFRILDTKRSGAHVYLDLDGNVPSNKINTRGKQQGRTKAEYNEVTHFKEK